MLVLVCTQILHVVLRFSKPFCRVELLFKFAIFQQLINLFDPLCHSLPARLSSSSALPAPLRPSSFVLLLPVNVSNLCEARTLTANAAASVFVCIANTYTDLH